MAMEWAEADGGLMADFPEDPFTFPTTCPESFFDASLDAMDVFGKDLFFSPPARHQYPQQQVGTMESLDFEAFFCTAMTDEPGDLLRGRGCSSITMGDSDTDHLSSLISDLDSLSDDCSTGDEQFTAAAVQPPAAVVIKQEKVEEEGGVDINRSLQAVEWDIAQLKKEVVDSSEENTMWSDFFSEEDPSEISREYDDLLQSLLSTPVNDIDLSLNVFNSVDANELEESAATDGEGAAEAVCVVKVEEEEEDDEQQSILSSIHADHCYTLARPPAIAASSSMLTPPPSSDESDRDDESSRDSCHDVKPTLLQGSKFGVSRSGGSNGSFPRRHLHNSDHGVKKVVKLKQHQSDLKFVFSFKLKDGSEVTTSTAMTAPAGRSLLKKNASKSCTTLPTGQRRYNQNTLQPTTAIGRHFASDPMALRQSPSKKHNRSTIKSSATGEYNETVCAVRSLIQYEAAGLGKMVPDFKNRKVQIDREIHNSMERQRRIELKREFDSLKNLIPEVADNDKVSKLTLLNVAARYVARLETAQTKLRWRKDLLKEKRKQLMQRLNFLHISA